MFDEDLRETTELNGYDSSVSRQSAASVENMEEEAEANNKRISPETLKQSPMDRTTFMGLPKIGKTSETHNIFYNGNLKP